MNGLKINTVRPLINATALTGANRLAAAVEKEINDRTVLEQHLSVYRDLTDISECLKSIVVREDPRDIYKDLGLRLETLAESLRRSGSQADVAILKNEIKLEVKKIPDFILEDIRKAAGLMTPKEIFIKGASGVLGILSLPVEVFHDIVERASDVWGSVKARLGRKPSDEEQKELDKFGKWLQSFAAEVDPVGSQPLSQDELESVERVKRRMRFGTILRMKGKG